MWMKQGFPTICAPNYHESALPKPQIIKSGIFARWMFKGKKVTIIVPFPLGWTKIATNWFKLTDNWPKWSRMAQNRRGSCGKWPNLAETAWYPSAPPQLPAAVIQKIGVLQNCLQNLQDYNFFCKILINTTNVAICCCIIITNMHCYLAWKMKKPDSIFKCMSNHK